jgi:hypothetical protein
MVFVYPCSWELVTLFVVTLFVVTLFVQFQRTSAPPAAFANNPFMSSSRLTFIQRGGVVGVGASVGGIHERLILVRVL